MPLPYKPLDLQISPDDVTSAEQMNELYRAHNDAVDLLDKEHHTTGREIGLHDVVTIPDAVASIGLERITETLGRNPEPGDMDLFWAQGFEIPPRLFVGVHPLFASPPLEGVFLEWRVADRRHGLIQLVSAMYEWDTTSPIRLPEKPMWRAVGRDGALFLGGMWLHEETSRRMPAPTLWPIQGLGVFIHLIGPRP